jgi:DNA-binding response OmpR family regulator
MIHLLLVTRNKTAFSDFSGEFIKRNGVSVAWADSGEGALSLVSEKRFDLVVTDEELGDMAGLVFAKKLVTQYPMVNCAAVSPLSEEAFHEASEGLGLQAKLPIPPGKKDARNLLERLLMIKGMTSGARV